ncbi:phage tail tape measure protein [Streptomyces sp. NPDC058420]|uniref:phage tail tape measure protein n=1 Tax=Streptomyces sp. NPDC058420 TaxID=3346489 RepID=UPI003652F8EB
MALTVGELAATITVDDSEAEQGLDSFQNRLRAALARITQRARAGGEDAGSALGDGLDEAAGDGAEEAGDTLTGKLKGLAMGLIGGALGAALMAGLSEAIGQGQITAKLGAQLGATPAEAKRYGEVAGELYSNAVTEDFQGAAEAIKATMGAGLLPPDATNAQIESISTKVADLSNTFDQDLGGVTNAVSQMLRTGLVSSADEAFDVLTKGFQSSANKADDLVDTFNEYGTQFRQAGLDGATAVGLMNQAIQAGARDSDIAADAIKEFGLRAVNGSASTAAGFQALGLNADDMAAKFGKGGTSATAALDTTLDRLRAIKDPIKQSQAATALFGTQAEDLGKALYAMDPSTAAKGLGEVGGAADTLGNTLRDNAGAQLTAFKNSMQQNLVGFLGDNVVPVLTTFFGFVGKHRAEFTTAAVVIGAAFAAIGAAATIAGAEMAAAWIAGLGPVGWVGMAIAALVVLVITYWDEIKGWTLTVWDWIVGKLIWAKDMMVQAFMNFTLIGLLISHWSSIRDTAVSSWNGIVGWVKGIPGRLYNLFLNWTLLGLIVKNWTAIKNATVGKATEMVDWIRGLPGRLSSAIGNNLSGLLVGKGKNIVQGLWNGIVSMGSWLRNKITGWAKEVIPGPVAKALGIASPSKVMAREVGRWIPAGVVDGIESGSGAVDRAMSNLVSVPTAGQATAANVAAQTASATSGGGTQPVVTFTSDGSRVGDFLLSVFRDAVNVRGGNVQFAVTGRSA